jgi:hypothetical protein
MDEFDLGVEPLLEPHSKLEPDDLNLNHNHDRFADQLHCATGVSKSAPSSTTSVVQKVSVAVLHHRCRLLRPILWPLGMTWDGLFHV